MAKSVSKTKADSTPSTKASETEKVDAFMKALKYPLKDMVQYLREFILKVDKQIGEEIAWNAPTFFFIGILKPYPPKEYRRFIVGFNFYQKDNLRIIFLRGASADDPKGILEGDYKDGRRLVSFKTMVEVKSKEKELKKIVKQLVDLIAKDLPLKK